ncbi:MAG: PmeII family type II restriction endonuclease [Candidatus Altimarinota bacterium]
MTKKERQEILEKFKLWFKDSLIVSHKKNTEKLVDINKFQINPFLLYYIANFLNGDAKPESLAKALIYPRVLGTSITTSFGTQMQSFITKVLLAYGSTTKGIDIEFVDQIDGRKKYCQLKSGPNAINRDDVKTITDHFKGLKNLARTNGLKIDFQDLVFCMIYGENNEKNAFVKEVEKEYTIFMGKEFWTRFTGDEHFYRDLIKVAGDVAKEVNMKDVVDEVVKTLSGKIEERFKNISS